MIMSDWSSGYVADIGYTYGYYPGTNPLRIKFAFLSVGLAFPEVDGLRTGIRPRSEHKYPCRSISHRMARHGFQSRAGWLLHRKWRRLPVPTRSSTIKLLQTFAIDQICRISIYIGLHGIWSWISDENRSIIVDFVKRKLKVGGVLYISYNTLPGWAAFAPMRHLMTEHAEIIGAEGRGIVNRINDAIEFADKLLSTNPLFSRANPLVRERIKTLKGQNRHYLAHEYFNRDWTPMHFSSMAEWLEPAKLSFACSAHFLITSTGEYR